MIYYQVTDADGRTFGVEIREDDKAYRLEVEGDEGFREERFASYADAVEGIAELWPEPTYTVTLQRA